MRRLIQFCGHILALVQLDQSSNQELFTDYMSVYCEHLRQLPQEPRAQMKELAGQIILLPLKEQHLAIKLITAQLLTPECKSQWLQTLLKEYEDKAILLPYCLEFITHYPDNYRCVVPILRALPKKDLLALYLLMVTKGINKSAFHCFKELFKGEQGLTLLVDILSQKPLSLIPIYSMKLLFN